MKTILVPTDFSKCADNALRYAAELNKSLNTRILIFNSYHVPVPASDIPIDTKTEAELKKGALKSLQNLKTAYSEKYPGMEFLVETTSGFADDEIVARVEKNQADYVVMGTHGSSGLREFLLGSNASTVMEKATCPVFAIPEEAVFGGIGHVVFAADYGTHNFNNVLKVIELLKPFDPEIALLHIRSGKLDEALEHSELEGFRNRVREESRYSRLSIALVDDSDVYHGLSSFVEEAKPSLLVLSMRNRNFVQKIFSRSITKRMAHHGRTPLLVLHAGS